MTIHKFVLFAAAAALSGCASMEISASNQVPVQRALYVASDSSGAAPFAAVNGPLTTAMVVRAGAEQANSPLPGASKPMRIYWFLGDR